MRRSNLTTIRQQFEWSSDWNSSLYYLKLVFKDLLLLKYLINIFKILKFPTSKFIFNYSLNNYLFIFSDIYIKSIFILTKRSFFFTKKLIFFFDFCKYYKFYRNYNLKLLNLKFSFSNFKFYNFLYNFYNSNVTLFFLFKNIFFESSIFSFLNFFYLKYFYNLYNFFFSLVSNINYFLFFVIKSNFFKQYLKLFFFKKINFFFNSNLNLFICTYYTKVINFFKLNNIFNFFFFNSYKKNAIKTNVKTIKNIKTRKNYNKHNFNKNLKYKYKSKKIKFNNPVYKNYIYFFIKYIFTFKKIKYIRSRIKYKYFSLFLRLYLYFFKKKKFIQHYWYFKKWINCYLYIYLHFFFRKSKFFFFFKKISSIIFHFNKRICIFFLKKKKNMYKYYYNLYIKSFILFYKERYSLIGTVDLTYNKFDFFLSYYLINRYLITFFVSIEYTFFLITNRNCVLLFNLYYRYKPFIKSAKLLNDYIWFYLKLESNRKSSISFIYKKIKKWQYKNLNFYNIFYKYYFFRYKYRNIPVLLFKNKFKFNTIFFRSFYSLYGIRILCSGTFYKGRRKLRKFYHLWVADVSLTGKMPLNSMKFNIDFYKSSIPLKHASLGLKVWLLLCN